METVVRANPFEPLVKRARKELEELLAEEKAMETAFHAAADGREKHRLHACLHALRRQIYDKRGYITRYGG